MLIQYDRPDAAVARESRYRLTRVEDPDDLRASLDAALGTLVVVDKERHLFLWDGVRIHLDTVEGLGSFVELEGVAPAGVRPRRPSARRSRASSASSASRRCSPTPTRTACSAPTR